MRRLSLIALLVAGVALAAPPAALGVDTRPRFVIAVLGDSYSSGEGSPDVHGKHSLLGDLVALECIQLPTQPPPCFTETWWSPDSWFSGRDAVFPQQDDAGWQAAARRCHRSSKAPGPHAAMMIADRFPDVRVEVLDFACGGSTIGPSCGLIPGVNASTLTCLPLSTDPGGGVLLGWKGPEPPDGASDLPPQLTALRDYANNTGRANAIDAIVMNIGGNDGEFAELVAECLNIINPIDDCTNNPTLARIRQKLLPDATFPGAGDANEPMSERYRRVDAAIQGAQGGVGRPDELYLGALPNATHDAPPVDHPATNPQDFCDGTQTSDDFYNNATLAESQAIEGILDGLNDAMARASALHGWVFMPQMFEAWRDHGICAEGASFIRTNAAGLRIQGDEGIPLPHISAGIGHPNEAGHANRAAMIADMVEEQVRMRFRPPTLALDSVQANTAFNISWGDPSPNHLVETKWELELASPGSVQRFFSSGAGSLAGFNAGSANSFGWRVARQGDFQVRVRGCRTTQTDSYCGPFSNAITVATGVPGTPLDLRRTALTGLDTGANPVRVSWARGPNTPASARFELHYGRVGGGCSTGQITSCTILSDGASVNTTSTTAKVNLPQTGEWRFRIRACSTAGCSAFSGFLNTTVSGSAIPKTPVGTFVVRLPRRVRAGKRARVDIAWRTPKAWTALDRIDIRLAAKRSARRGTIRFSQDDGVLWAIRGKRRRFGHPDTSGTLNAGAVEVNLARSAIVRFGKKSRRVVLRLSIVPSRKLRGKTLTLAISARNDRGRKQRARLGGLIKVR